MSASLLAVLLLATGGEAAERVDASTLTGRTLCGYQGWFRCPDDPAGRGWRHWSRDRDRLSPRSLTVEMWPETGEYPVTYPAPGFEHPNGEPARLFSCADESAVDLHFQWMREHGLDGVFAQRFLVELNDPSQDLVLKHVRTAAERHGRIYAVCYDLTGAPPGEIYDRLTADWRRQVNVEGLTADRQYLKHRGRPVVFLWGLYPERFDAALTHRLLDFFQEDGPYAATVVGGVQWQWRTVEDPGWAAAFRRLDVISPWNVGNMSVDAEGVRWAATGSWKQDLEAATAAGADFLPVIYPGFSWTNLKGPAAAADALPRRGGAVFRRQFEDAAALGLTGAYVAMFDEVDEATAIFKTSPDPPTAAPFLPADGPPDRYLKLTAEGARLLRRTDRPPGE
ncbi:glycoside hydrolase family 71/99-like protein [Alienimonas californiensis]|uniref:Xylosidase/arabinosidase n=1 Tax=Alienimonas californiensis TaxID=2527989 RepID=A0A517P4V6_9PLAN|nr:glycoside hydrolase family 71/99-like protein [Alienimonas californiensis]QDT14404.1 hypothetical protein CA12_04770 [Alienimonas californiensis]